MASPGGKKRGKSSSRRVLYVAIAANIAIALSKYVAAAVTSSPAMLAEAFHSTADSCNEFLLLFGVRRSERPPDELHPFGHGKELYFWSLVVAIVIFGLGAGCSLDDGNPDKHYGASSVPAKTPAYSPFSWRTRRPW